MHHNGLILTQMEHIGGLSLKEDLSEVPNVKRAKNMIPKEMAMLLVTGETKVVAEVLWDLVFQTTLATPLTLEPGISLARVPEIQMVEDLLEVQVLPILNKRPPMLTSMTYGILSTL